MADRVFPSKGANFFFICVFLKGLLLGTHPVFKQTLEFEKKTILYRI